MRFFLISDNTDTQTGMRLAGIEGVVAHTAEEFTEIVNDAKKNQEGPMVLAIPDRHGSALGRDRITRYVREAIGVKI